MTKLKLNDVIQFNENHKWCGALGIVSEIKELENDTKYLIGVPIPHARTKIQSLGQPRKKNAKSRVPTLARWQVSFS